MLGDFLQLKYQLFFKFSWLGEVETNINGTLAPRNHLTLGSHIANHLSSPLILSDIAILNQLPDQIGLKALRSNKPILNLISDCYI
jgi:hypothetical protein